MVTDDDEKLMKIVLMRKLVINDNLRFHSMCNRNYRLNPEKILMKKEWSSHFGFDYRDVVDYMKNNLVNYKMKIKGTTAIFIIFK